MMKYWYTFKSYDEGYDDLIQDALMTLVQQQTSDGYRSDSSEDE